MSSASGSVASLVQRLDAAVATSDPSRICAQVKGVLTDELGRGRIHLPEPLLRTVPSGYARRRLHMDPAGRFSVVVMVWGPGQGTPLHDHAGHWCVECVVAGKIRVTSFELQRQEADRAFFELREVVDAGVGAAGALIPPFQHHRIDNPHEDTAVTLHVYRGEITWCHAFEPLDESGWFRPRRRELAYSP